MLSQLFLAGGRLLPSSKGRKGRQQTHYAIKIKFMQVAKVRDTVQLRNKTEHTRVFSKKVP